MSRESYYGTSPSFSARNSVTLSFHRKRNAGSLARADVIELMERVKSYAAFAKLKASSFKPVSEAKNMLVVSNGKLFFVAFMEEGGARFSSEYSLERCHELADEYASGVVREFAYFPVDTCAYPRQDRWEILKAAGFDKGEYTYLSSEDFNAAIKKVQSLGLNLDTTMGTS